MEVHGMAASSQTHEERMQETASASLYDRDFALWAKEQAAALRAGRFAHVDIANVAEEIEALAASDRRALRSHLRTLMLHLLKLKYQPGMATPSWSTSVLNASSDIDELLADSPSLRASIPAISAKAYEQARKLASTETGLPLATFPKTMTPEFGEAVRAALAGADEE
jgi:hypothetical protein